MRFVTRVSIGVWALCLPACSEQNVRTPEGPTWTAASTPRLRLGERDELVLSRVVGAIALPDGQVIVGEASTGSLLFLDETGTVNRRIGGLGEGPGEFVGLSWVGLWEPDTVVAFDARLRRLSAFTRDGVLVDTWSDESSDLAFASPRGVLGNGEVVVVAESRASTEPLRADRIQRFPSLLAQSTRRGALIRVMKDPVYGAQAYLPPESQVGRVIMMPVIHGYDFHLVAGSGGVWWGYTGEPTLWYDDGSTVGSVSLPTEVPRWPVTAEMRLLEVERMLDAGPSAGSGRAAQFLAEAPSNERLPVFDRLVVDRSDRAWIRLVSPDRPGQWVVLSETGEVVGRIVLPQEFTPTFVRAGLILGVWVSDLGVESVRAYEWEQD